uniref:Uncharacterized protein n=1 Tax=viral metagenome TaxID=1070528 RepID=A0A6C0EQU9_9ZZZZ
MEYLYYYIFLIIVIISISYIGTINHTSQKETFTPFIREKYRPYVRNARIYTEGFYNKHKNNVTNLFKRFGIM